jgi:hypothetical protein
MATQAEILIEINKYIKANGIQAITGGVLNGVLALMNTYMPTFTDLAGNVNGLNSENLQTILEEMFSLIGETMTAIEIRDALQSLSKSQQLVKTYVRGADGAINIRPQGDVHDATFQTGFMQDILKGDRWKYYKTGTPPPTEGYTLNIGDWVIASRDGVTTYDFGNTANWELVNFPNNDLTAVEIAALLNSLTTINEMVIANRIKYNETLTVAGKIEAMDIEIEKKQNKITRNRYLYANPINGKVFLIGGKTADIFSLRINRTPLEGVRALDFNVEAAAYDYIYKTINETDTQITLSPDLGIEFKAGTIIDVQW